MFIKPNWWRHLRKTELSKVESILWTKIKTGSKSEEHKWHSATASYKFLLVQMVQCQHQSKKKWCWTRPKPSHEKQRHVKKQSTSRKANKWPSSSEPMAAWSWITQELPIWTDPDQFKTEREKHSPGKYSPVLSSLATTDSPSMLCCLCWMCRTSWLYFSWGRRYTSALDTVPSWPS